MLLWNTRAFPPWYAIFNFKPVTNNVRLVLYILVCIFIYRELEGIIFRPNNCRSPNFDLLLLLPVT